MAPAQVISRKWATQRGFLATAAGPSALRSGHLSEVQPIAPAALHGRSPQAVHGGWTLTARHLGLVLGIVGMLMLGRRRHRN